MRAGEVVSRMGLTSRRVLILLLLCVVLFWVTVAYLTAPASLSADSILLFAASQFSHAKWFPSQSQLSRANAWLREHPPLPPSLYRARHACDAFEHTPWRHSIAHDLRFWDRRTATATAAATAAAGASVRQRRITVESIERAWHTHHRFGSDMFRVQIIDNVLYGVERTDRGSDTRQWVDDLRIRKFLSEIASVLARVQLPDCEFVINSFDEPIIEATDGAAGAAGAAASAVVPVFSYCSGPQFADIRIPFPHDFKPESMPLPLSIAGTNSLGGSDAFAAAAANEWSKRQSTAVWRGTLTGYPKPESANWRENVRVRLCCEYSTAASATGADPGAGDAPLFDVGFTTYGDAERLPAGSESRDRVLRELRLRCPLRAAESMTAQARRYKYAIDVDGNSWSSRFVKWLPLGVVILKQQSAFHDFITPLLVPNQHFIPLKPDASDVVSVVQSFRAGDAAGETRSFEIAMRAREFAFRHFHPDGRTDATLARTQRL